MSDKIHKYQIFTHTSYGKNSTLIHLMSFFIFRRERFINVIYFIIWVCMNSLLPARQINWQKKTISQFLENSINTIVWSNYIHIIPLFPTISWQTRSNCNGPTDWVYRLIFPLLKAEKLREHLENLFKNSCKPCLYNIWWIINDQIKCIRYIFCQCIAKNFSRGYFIYYHNIFAEKRAKWPCYFITCRC